MPEPRSAPPCRAVVSGFSRTAALFDAAVLALATFAAFSPALRNEFVSWDDPSVLLDNPNLRDPGVVSWAFSTTFMGHYQPLAWIMWSAVMGQTAARAPAVHAVRLFVHAANGTLFSLV